MATYPNSRIQLRIDTENNWNTNNPTIESGELCLSTDKKDFKVGGGSLWRNAAYWISQNPTVLSIQTTANNASSTASNALSKANQAITIAQQAAGNSGRQIAPWNQLIEEYPNGIEIDNTFLEKYMNTDFVCDDFAEDMQVHIAFEGRKFDNGNTMTFYLLTGNNITFVSEMFTDDMTKVKEGFVLYNVKGQGVQKSVEDDKTIFELPANSYVKVSLIDCLYFEIEVMA